MAHLPDPPATYTEFVERYPDLGRAWEYIAQAGKDGPVDDSTARLVKLGIAIGAMREGAVHASVRKALAMGLPPEALEQVVAMGAGTMGFPATVAAYRWVQDVLGDHPPPEED